MIDQLLNPGRRYNGVYRGIVVDVQDTENRGRVRVHVHGIHLFHSSNVWFSEPSKDTAGSAFTAPVKVAEYTEPGLAMMLSAVTFTRMHPP